MNKGFAALVLLLASQACMAATVCRIVTGGAVAFGPYDTLSAVHTDTALNLLVRCDRSGGLPTVSVGVSLGLGANAATFNSRRMAHSGGSGDFLGYGLYRDVTRSSVWGFTTGIDTVSQTVSIPNNNSASMTFTIFGRIPALQDVSTGAYSDSVQVTVTP